MNGTESRIGRVRGIVIFYLSVYLKNPLQRLILTSPKLLLSVRPPQGWFGCRKAVATAACGYFRQAYFRQNTLDIILRAKKNAYSKPFFLRFNYFLLVIKLLFVGD